MASSFRELDQLIQNDREIQALLSIIGDRIEFLQNKVSKSSDFTKQEESPSKSTTQNDQKKAKQKSKEDGKTEVKSAVKRDQSTKKEEINKEQPKSPISSGSNSKTELLYWNDTYLFEEKAVVVGIEDDPQTKNNIVILNQTIFYPQGGGQPSDQGEIIGSNGAKFVVSEVKSRGDQVLHKGIFESEANRFAVGESVVLKLDQEKRKLHARLHSGGHLLDAACQRVGLTYLEPEKGHHFVDAPYVEYGGTIPVEERDKIREQLEVEANNMIQQGSKVIVEILPYSRLGEKFTKIPSYLPKDKDVRVVTVGNTASPCAGTHVKDVREIQKLVVKKITVRGGKTRVSYDLK